MIKISGLNKIFHERQSNAFHALKAIDLHVSAGELVILKGVSGSGKSTLLSLIGALAKPSSGTIIIDNHPITKLPDLHASHFRSEMLGFIFQSFNLFDTLSVADNVALPLLHRALHVTQIESMVTDAMQRAGIIHKQHSEVRLLSGGEKQRCAIARALVNDPKVILCDEPTANLDAHNTLEFLALLTQMHESKKTIIVATHDPIFDTLSHARFINIDKGVLNEP